MTSNISSIQSPTSSPTPPSPGSQPELFTAAPHPTSPPPHLQHHTDRHPELFHNGTAYECPFKDDPDHPCNFIATAPGQMFKHLRSAHGPRGDMPDPAHDRLLAALPQYACMGCGKLFRRLKDHQRKTCPGAPSTGPTPPPPASAPSQDSIPATADPVPTEGPIYATGIAQMLAEVRTLSYADFVDILVHTPVIRTLPVSVESLVSAFLDQFASLVLACPDASDSFHKLVCFIPAILILRGSTAKRIKTTLDRIARGEAAGLATTALNKVQAHIDRLDTRPPPRPRNDHDKAIRAGQLIRMEDMSKAGRELAEGLSMALLTPENLAQWEALHPASDWDAEDATIDTIRQLLGNPWPHRDGPAPPLRSPIPSQGLPEYPDPFPPGPHRQTTGASNSTAHIPSSFLDKIPTILETAAPEMGDIVRAGRAIPTRTHPGPFGWSISLVKAGLPSPLPPTGAPDAPPRLAGSPLAVLISRWGAGHAPDWFVTHVYSCSVGIILVKKTGGLRPTAVGFGGRRVFSAYMKRIFAAPIKASMPDGQFGLDTKGTETVAHLTRDRLRPGGTVPPQPLECAPSLFMADETNAFNRVSRRLFLHLAHAHWPARLAKYVQRLYEAPNKLVLGSAKLWATAGVTQGCTLGPALYNLTTAPAIVASSHAIAAALQAQGAGAIPRPLVPTSVAAYADDGNTVGGLAAAYHGMAAYIHESQKVGKVFNPRKCRYHTPCPRTYDAICQGSHEGWIQAGPLRIPLRRTDQGEVQMQVQGLWCPVSSPEGVELLGVPIGTDEYVATELQALWDAHNKMVGRIALMPDTQSALLALRTLAVSRAIYTIRTVPPSQCREYVENWDKATRDVLVSLTRGAPLRPHQHVMFHCKTRDGGCSIPSLVELAPLAYAASVVGVTPRLSRESVLFETAWTCIPTLPPIDRNNLEECRTEIDAKLQIAAQRIDPDHPSPEFLAISLWLAVSHFPDLDLALLFCGRDAKVDDLPSCLPPSWFVDHAATAKWQRASAHDASRQARAVYLAALENDMDKCSSPQRSHDRAELARDYRHASHSWAPFYALMPWLPQCALAGDVFATVVRYHLRMEPDTTPRLGHSMTCNCTNRSLPPRCIPSATYHAYTCGFGALIRKKTHDFIVTRTVALINQGAVMVATENPHAERAHMGRQSDIDLAPHPFCPAGCSRDIHQYNTSDISITAFVHASDVHLGPGALRSKDHKTQRYDAKRTGHSDHSKDAPIIFDTRASIEPRSKATLLALLGKDQRHRLRLYLQVVTAAIARMLGLLDRRNTLRRIKQTCPQDPNAAMDDDDTEALAIHLEVQRRDRALYLDPPIELPVEADRSHPREPREPNIGNDDDGVGAGDSQAGNSGDGTGDHGGGDDGRGGSNPCAGSSDDGTGDDGRGDDNPHPSNSTDVVSDDESSNDNARAGDDDDQAAGAGGGASDHRTSDADDALSDDDSRLDDWTADRATSSMEPISGAGSREGASLVASSPAPSLSAALLVAEWRQNRHDSCHMTPQNP